MPIILNFEQRQHQALDSIEVYRALGGNTPLDISNPGTPIATLAGNAVRYEDSDVLNNTTYRYWLAAKKGEERVFNSPVAQGYFLDTGPGPQKLLYGDWHAGYFGVVSQEELFTHAELNSLLGGSMCNAFSNWHKFIFKNHIVYYPDLATLYGTIAQFYNAGIQYGQDGSGYIPSGGSSKNQRRILSKNGYEFVPRLPYVGDYATWTTPLANNYQLFYDGEWFNTFARLYAFAGYYPRVGEKVVGTGTSVTDTLFTAFAQMFNSSQNYYVTPNAPEAISYGSFTSTWCRAFLVLDLVLP